MNFSFFAVNGWVKMNFTCPRCGNDDPRYFGEKDGIPYCRLCLSYQGKTADSHFRVKEGITLSLDYPLSPKQEEVSSQVFYLLKQKKNVLIHAVTGAGKTELVYQSMERFLQRRLHVGFATPRKDVVIDLVPRIQEAFPSADVIALYGGHTEKIEGDIIVLTTHQLYRYPQYFDLLILDEIDAFPYRDDPLLHAFFYRSIRGNYVLLSATPSQEDLEKIKKDNGEVVTLFERYHQHPLPEPEYVKTRSYTAYFQCLSLLSKFLSQNSPVFIFVPTIEIGRKLYHFLSLFVRQGAFVSSEEERRKIDIQRFKGKALSFLVTTSILERGVTVKNLQVIVFDASHPLYQRATLVQIAGRVGRKIGAEGGHVYFLADTMTKKIKEAVDEIHSYNRRAHLL